MLKKFILILLFVFIPVTVLWFYHEAKNDSEQDAQKVLGVEKQTEEKEKKESANLFPLDTAYAAGFVPTRKAGYPDMKIWAGSSVAIDVESGTILHYDDGRKKTQIASLTKIMTAVLVMEKVKDLDDEATITREAMLLPGTVVGCPTTGVCPSNRMYTGEKVRVMDLLKAMLMNSANDAAYSLAVHVAGNEKEFVKMMNEKTRDLGLKDTNFCTASGLEIDGREDECYSTAYDIARIGAYALNYDTIWQIMRIPEGKFYSSNGKYMHELKNTDLLLEELPGCIGGKTGFTPLAGKSLLMAAKDPTNKHKIVAVLLNDEQRWEDMKTLVNWIFESYEWK